MLVSEVLSRAADLLEPEGAWTQWEYARSASGAPTDSRQKAVCFCAIGAMSVAANFGPADEMEPVECDKVLRDVIGGYSISVWNDAPDRTQTEVVAKLREAAALAKKQGQ